MSHAVHLIILPHLCLFSLCHTLIDPTSLLFLVSNLSCLHFSLFITLIISLSYKHSLCTTRPILPIFVTVTEDSEFRERDNIRYIDKKYNSYSASCIVEIELILVSLLCLASFTIFVPHLTIICVITSLSFPPSTHTSERTPWKRPFSALHLWPLPFPTPLCAAVREWHLVLLVFTRHEPFKSLPPRL